MKEVVDMTKSNLEYYTSHKTEKIANEALVWMKDKIKQGKLNIKINDYAILKAPTSDNEIYYELWLDYESTLEEPIVKFAKKMQDFDFALLNINERLGEDFTKRQISKIKVVGNYVFFQIDEATFYHYEDNESKDVILAIDLDNIHGEIVCDFDAKSFDWSKKALQKVSDDLDTI